MPTGAPTGQLMVRPPQRCLRGHWLAADRCPRDFVWCSHGFA
jgi:hypothetical protein